MGSHPEERRIAGLLRELIVQSGIPPESVAERLGWPPDRLAALLEGNLALSFGDVLRILPLVGTTPTDFFALLYGFDPRESAAVSKEGAAKLSAGDAQARRLMDRWFECSLRAVRNAVAKRSVGKSKPTDGG
jgi:plasmid maintenance system antidote protein VapI